MPNGSKTKGARQTTKSIEALTVQISQNTKNMDRLVKSVDSMAIQVAKNSSDISTNTGILIRMERKIDEVLAVGAESTQPRVKKCEQRLDDHDRRFDALEKTS